MTYDESTDPLLHYFGAWTETMSAFAGLTRFGERATTIAQVAAAMERPEEEVIKLLWEVQRIRPDSDGRIHVDNLLTSSVVKARRKVHIGDREVPVTGCAPDLFLIAAVIDGPLRVEDTCPVTGVPIRIAFQPGALESVDPPETVVTMPSPEQFAQYAKGEAEEVDKSLCSQAPFLSSAEAARESLGDRPSGARVYTAAEMVQRPFFTTARDIWRPRILAAAARDALT